MLLLLLASLQDADVDALIRELAAEELDSRERAQRALVELGLRSRPAVLRATRHTDPETAGRAWRILKSYPPTVRMEELYEAGFRRETAAALPEFARKIWASDPKTVVEAVREAATKSGSGDLRALATVLDREEMHETVRQTFAQLLESRRDPALAATVVPLLRHPNVFVREGALRALVAARAKEQGPALLAALEDKDLVRKALEGLESLGVPVPDDAVRKMLTAPDEFVRLTAVGLARSRDPKSFRSDLIHALLHARSFEPWTVLDAVVRSEPAWPDLEPLLKSDHGETRLSALRAARRRRLPEALEAAVRLLDDRSGEARTEAIQAVVAWGGPEARRRAADGRGPGSLVALAKLKDPRAKERALDALRSPDAAMRRAGLAALRAIDAHDEADRVASFLEDEAAEVRVEAARILPHLAGDGVGPKIVERLSKEPEPNVQAQLFYAAAQTGCEAATPLVLKVLEKADRHDLVVSAAAHAAGAFRCQEAAPALVRLRHYDALVQIRPRNLVDLLRPELKAPSKKNEKEDPFDTLGKWRERREVVEHNDRILYLLYVSPPGAREFLAECIGKGIEPQHPVDEITYHRAVETFPWLLEEIEKGGLRDLSGAGRLLASWGRRDLADRAVTWLSSSTPETRRIATEFLGGLKAREKIPQIAALLESPKAEFQWAAWNTLSWIGGPETVEVFRRRLSQGTPMNRANAALFLGRQGDHRSIPEIEPLLEDEAPEVRETAAGALAALRSASSFDRIVRAYRRGPGKDVRNWHWHLVQAGGPRGRAVVREHFDHPEVPVRENAVRAQGWGGDYRPEEGERLEAYLYDPDVGDETRDALARMDPARLLRHAEDPRSRLFMGGGNWGSGLLESIGPPAIPALVGLLEDDDENNRWHAAQILGRWGVREAIEPLARALHSDDRHSPKLAAVALARLGDARGLDTILRLPRETTPHQGRMQEALLALNGIRHPETFRKAAAVRWKRDAEGFWTLEGAVDELARRTGMTNSFSKGIQDLDRRTPSGWPWQDWSLDEIASRWRGLATIILEPGLIRVMSPEEALDFWKEWARMRGPQ